MVLQAVLNHYHLSPTASTPGDPVKNDCPYVTKSTVDPSVTVSTDATEVFPDVASIPLTKNSIPLTPETAKLAIAC